MKEVAIETVGLGRRYGTRWALQDCDLQVPAGTVTGLVGPNGAGKSTLMRLCVGLSRPTTGRVSILGVPVRPNGTEHLPHVGYLDQHRPMYASLRVEEAMRLGRTLNTRWDDDAARTWIAQLDVPPRARLSSLSEGQVAMVALVVCLAKRPDVLVLDEPLASLDPLARRQLMETLLDAVAERGTTVFLSSHIISELETVCDHLVIMSGGRIRIAGSVDSLLAEHHLVVTRSDGPPLPSTLETVSLWGAQRQSTSLVRGDVSGLDEGVEVLETNVEEIVLAYLAHERGGTRDRAGTRWADEGADEEEVRV
jgi:ABC-2 type transport system ATP-binding protein